MISKFGYFLIFLSVFCLKYGLAVTCIHSHGSEFLPAPCLSDDSGCFISYQKNVTKMGCWEQEVDVGMKNKWTCMSNEYVYLCSTDLCNPSQILDRFTDKEMKFCQGYSSKFGIVIKGFLVLGALFLLGTLIVGLIFLCKKRQDREAANNVHFNNRGSELRNF